MGIAHSLVRATRPIIERFPGIALAYRTLRDARGLSREPLDTPLGFKLVGNPGMEAGQFEPEETRLIGALLERVDVFINVGANIGYYCCLALSRQKHVVAFEPMPGNLGYLYKNVKANGGDGRAEVFPLALGNRVGIAEMRGGGTGASLVKGWAGTSDANVTLVPTSTFDNVVGGRFSARRCLVLIDVEGFERFMLEGAADFLRREPKPIWVVEIAVREHQPQGVTVNPHLVETFELFWRAGYRAFTADDRVRPVPPDEVVAVSRGGPDTLGTHNFLFVDPTEHVEALSRQ